MIHGRISNIWVVCDCYITFFSIMNYLAKNCEHKLIYNLAHGRVVKPKPPVTATHTTPPRPLINSLHSIRSTDTT